MSRFKKGREQEMKNILILNGAYRAKGSTVRLVEAFSDGARSAGHEVIRFDVCHMDIAGCTGCLHARKKDVCPCVQHDDMDEIYKAFDQADVIVFASPLYFWTITGPLKTVADRLYAKLESLGYGGFARESVLLMSADGNDYSQAKTWYETYERNLGWTNRGEVLGKGKSEQARKLGASL